METSRHDYIDRYGYHCGIEIVSEDDDLVVFNSKPSLSFDLKKHGIKIRHSDHYDYILRYVLRDGQIFLRGIEAQLSVFHKNAQIFGVNAKAYSKEKRSIFVFDDIPVEYSGTLHIGKAFDHQYWAHDEKTAPVPFSPEVYKENGYIKFEKGTMTEKELISRK